MHNKFANIRQLITNLVSLYLDNAKLLASEKLTVLCSAAVMLIVCLVFGVFSLAFLSGACIELLALVLPLWASYLILGGFFILIIALVLLCRKWIIVNPIALFISKLIFEAHHAEEECEK